MTAHVPPAAAQSRLAHFPITFFATTMGLGGYALALRAAAVPLGLGPMPFRTVLAASLLAFGLIALAYLAKAVLHRAEVVAEWHHPVRLAFFPTASVSVLLLATALLSEAPALAKALWLFGTALQGVLTLSVITSWIGTRSFLHGHLNPAWFIPAVGNVIVPISGAQLGFMEVSFLFFAAGMMFWLILLTLVFNRLVFHDPMPGRLQPTLVIMIAPPAVAFISWVRMTGGVDAFAHILLSLGYVFAALVVVQLPRILRLPFAMSFWALSFPVAGLTIASFLYAEKTGSAAHLAIGTGLLGLLTLIIAGLVGRTALAMARGQICVPE